MADNAAAEATEEPEEGSDSSEDVYEVEKIVGKKMVDGKLLYKVRWVGYGPTWDTFEPPDNLGTCDDLIEKFNKQEEQRKQNRAKRAQHWTYISSDDDDDQSGAKSLLKDRFWNDLESGKVDFMTGGDLYSKIKTGRAAKPTSLKEKPAYETPPRGPQPSSSSDVTPRSDIKKKPAPKRRKSSFSPKKRKRSTSTKKGSKNTDTSLDLSADSSDVARTTITGAMKAIVSDESSVAMETGQTSAVAQGTDEKVSVTKGTDEKASAATETDESCSIATGSDKKSLVAMETDRVAVATDASRRRSDSFTVVDGSVDMDGWVPPEHMHMDVSMDTSRATDSSMETPPTNQTPANECFPAETISAEKIDTVVAMVMDVKPKPSGSDQRSDSSEQSMDTTDDCIVIEKSVSMVTKSEDETKLPTVIKLEEPVAVVKEESVAKIVDDVAMATETAAGVESREVAKGGEESVTKETGARSAWDLLTLSTPPPAPAAPKPKLPQTKLDFSPSKIKKISNLASKITAKKLEIDKVKIPVKKILSPAKIVDLSESEARSAVATMKTGEKYRDEVSSGASSAPVSCSSPIPRGPVTSDDSTMTSLSETEGAARSRPFDFLEKHTNQEQEGISSVNLSVVKTELVGTTDPASYRKTDSPTIQKTDQLVPVKADPKAEWIKSESQLQEVRPKVPKLTIKCPKKKTSKIKYTQSSSDDQKPKESPPKDSLIKKKKMGPKSKLRRSPSSESLKSTNSVKSVFSSTSDVSVKSGNTVQSATSSATIVSASSETKVKAESKTDASTTLKTVKSQPSVVSEKTRTVLHSNKRPRTIHRRVRRLKRPQGLKLPGTYDWKKVPVVFVKKINFAQHAVALKQALKLKWKAKVVGRTPSVDSVSSHSTTSKSSSDTVIVMESDEPKPSTSKENRPSTPVSKILSEPHLPEFTMKSAEKRKEEYEAKMKKLREKARGKVEEGKKSEGEDKKQRTNSGDSTKSKSEEILISKSKSMEPTSTATESKSKEPILTKSKSEAEVAKDKSPEKTTLPGKEENKETRKDNSEAKHDKKRESESKDKDHKSRKSDHSKDRHRDRSKDHHRREHSKEHRSKDHDRARSKDSRDSKRKEHRSEASAERKKDSKERKESSSKELAKKDSDVKSVSHDVKSVAPGTTSKLEETKSKEDISVVSTEEKTSAKETVELQPSKIPGKSSEVELSSEKPAMSNPDAKSMEPKPKSILRQTKTMTIVTELQPKPHLPEPKPKEKPGQTSRLAAAILSRDRSSLDSGNIRKIREPPRPSRVIQLDMEYPKFQKSTTNTDPVSMETSETVPATPADDFPEQPEAESGDITTNLPPPSDPGFTESEKRATAETDLVEEVDMDICESNLDLENCPDDEFFALLDKEIRFLSSEDLEKLDEELEVARTTVLTPVEMKTAVKEGDYRKLHLALSNGEPGRYNLETCDHTGMTLLMLAAFSGHVAICSLLVQYGAQVNAAQKAGATALIHAAERGHAGVVTRLLQLGADVNCVNSVGESALIRAVRKGQRDVVQALVNYGPNVWQANHADMSAVRLSHLMKNFEIREMLDNFAESLRTVFVEEITACTDRSLRLGEPVFPVQCFSLRESKQFTLTFSHELRPIRDGHGMILCLAHAIMTSSGPKCRLYGACAVRQVNLNKVAQVPLTRGGMFVMTFSPLHNGKNELIINTDHAPKSKAKLIVCAYDTQLK